MRLVARRPPLTSAAGAQEKIESEGILIGKAIATHDFEVIRKYWSPALVVNNPANLIVGREQVIDSMNHGGLNYTSLRSTPEYFTVSNGTAIRMIRENLVMAAGPMAGKHLVRRGNRDLPAFRRWLAPCRSPGDIRRL